jgi:hypothetical protein
LWFGFRILNRFWVWNWIGLNFLIGLRLELAGLRTGFIFLKKKIIGVKLKKKIIIIALALLQLDWVKVWFVIGIQTRLKLGLLKTK